MKHVFGDILKFFWNVPQDYNLGKKLKTKTH